MRYSSGRPPTPHELTVVQRQIEVIDRQIGAQVYERYGLIEEEIGDCGG